MLPLGMLTISGSTIARSIKSETRSQYLHDTVLVVVKQEPSQENISQRYSQLLQITD